VQEALTNCARHAQAKSIKIAIHGGSGAVSLSVQDDGVGIATTGSLNRGMGLIGIEERARELGGTMSIRSESGKGTTLRVRIPWPREVSV